MIATTKKADRRKSERFSMTHSTVVYKRSGLLSFIGNGFSANNPLVNMGRGGAQFIAPEYIKPGTGLVLQVDVPAFVGGMCFRLKRCGPRNYPAKRRTEQGLNF